MQVLMSRIKRDNAAVEQMTAEAKQLQAKVKQLEARQGAAATSAAAAAAAGGATVIDDPAKRWVGALPQLSCLSLDFSTCCMSAYLLIDYTDAEAW
jgi:methyl-accepting chemotaxis protein